MQYRVLLIIRSEKFSHYSRITSQLQKFFGKFFACENYQELIIVVRLILWKLVKAGNYKRFFGNEGKDVKEQKFFNVNNKQYMVVSMLKAANNSYLQLVTKRQIKT